MKRPVGVLTTVVLLAGATLLLGASPEGQWLGVLWTKGGVTVGNAQVSSGTTIMPGDVITTSEQASAWVRFRSPASTVLAPNTQVMMLSSDAAPSLILRRGKMVVEDKTADPVQVAVRGGFVLVQGDAQGPAECEMASLENAATVSVKSGLAEIHGEGAPVLLRPGQSARLGADPQSAEQVAGRINKEIPQGTVDRVGHPQPLPLTLNQVIDWNDLVRTMERGRAQITLLDGSTLNVGARSELRIIRHEPEKQQTELQLTMGKLQANVQKITTPGGKFELRSSSAVIGTVDTAFVSQVDGDKTTICGVDGTTSVRSSDPNISKVVYLKKGECTVVILGQAPTDPVLNLAEMTSLLDQTSLAAAAAVSAGVSGGGSAIPWTWVGVGAGALAAAAVVGVVLASGGSSVSPTTP